MAQSFFIWKNQDCRSMGVQLQGPVAIVRPEERVEHVEIQGRSGDLTELEGEDIYNSYIQTATILVKGGFRVREINKWLRGSGYVTFSGEPDRKQAARIIGAVTLNRHSYNLDWWVGEVQFYCQPLKERLIDSAALITASGGTITNAGDVRSRPRITATASGTSLSITAGGNTLTVTGMTNNQKIIIDSDMMEILNEAEDTLLTKDSAGDFPMLEPGSNTITGSGWSRLEIERRERFL